MNQNGAVPIHLHGDSSNNNNNNNNNINSDDTQAQIEQGILHPHDHDVLLGRGGLSNHHPGNNWFRRLVRSNRELYDHSLKHTKLLIAKAIVHHVQTQTPPGRFLRKDKSSQLWEQVSYKKAVEKTSQALREKKVIENEDTLDEILPQPFINQFLDSISTSSTNYNNATTDFTITKQPQPPLQQTASWFWRNNKKQKISSSLPSESGFSIPLPTEPLTKRASSLFRFFTNSKNSLEPSTTTTAPYNFDYQPMPTQVMTNNSFFKSNSMNSSIESNFNGDCTTSIEPMPLVFDKKRPRDETLAAPSLTRLTSQVSSWLQSFYPLGDGNDHVPLFPKQQSLPPPSQPVEPPPPVEQQNPELSTTAPSAPMSASDLQREISMISKRIEDLQQQLQSGETDSATMAIILGEIQIQMQRLREAMMTQSQCELQNSTVPTTPQPPRPAPPPPPPPTFEPSVSSAVWKLASSPTILFAGFSRFFSESYMPSEVSLPDHGSIISKGANDVLSRLEPETNPTARVVGHVAIDSRTSLPDGSNGMRQDLDHSRNGHDAHHPSDMDCDRAAARHDPFEDSNPAKTSLVIPMSSSQKNGAVNNAAVVGDNDSGFTCFGRRTSASLFDDDADD